MKTSYQLLPRSKLAFEKAIYTNVEEGFQYQVALGDIPANIIKQAKRAASQIFSELQLKEGFQIEIHGCKYLENFKRKCCGLLREKTVSIISCKIIAAAKACSEELSSSSGIKKVAYAFFKEFQLPKGATLILSFKNS